MLKKLIETIRMKERANNTDFWLSNESCNKLLQEAESIRITDAGAFELKFNSGDIVGIKTEGILLFYGTKNSYVKVRYLNDEFNAIEDARRCIVL